MTLYKLRAEVDIRIDEEFQVGALWQETPPEGAHRDLRFRGGEPVYRVYGDEIQREDHDGYTRLRIAHGVAESGADFALSDVFPHDVLLDLNGGVSFKKGCFVGQEVVSRMQHRGTARRRLAQVTADEALPASGTEITAGGKVIGTLGTVLSREGLAIIRTDRAGSAIEAGTPITAGDVELWLSLPEWTGLQMAAGEDA
jgi:folate-binding protein YgfZ